MLSHNLEPILDELGPKRKELIDYLKKHKHVLGEGEIEFECEMHQL